MCFSKLCEAKFSFWTPQCLSFSQPFLWCPSLLLTCVAFLCLGIVWFCKEQWLYEIVTYIFWEVKRLLFQTWFAERNPHSFKDKDLLDHPQTLISEYEIERDYGPDLCKVAKNHTAVGQSEQVCWDHWLGHGVWAQPPTPTPMAQRDVGQLKRRGADEVLNITRLQNQLGAWKW